MNIFGVYKVWNLFEYKSPGDYVSVADFYKVYGYACLYASFKRVPVSGLSISFVESRRPAKLLRHLRDERGYTVAKTAPGIYTVTGDVIPMQLIDSRRLSENDNLWLKSLSDKLDLPGIERISEEITRQDKGAQVAAYLDVITEANIEIVEEAMAMKKRKTVEEVFIETGFAAKIEARGRVEGAVQKAFSIAQNMVNLGLPFETVVSATQLEPEKVQALYRNA